MFARVNQHFDFQKFWNQHLFVNHNLFFNIILFFKNNFQTNLYSFKIIFLSFIFEPKLLFLILLNWFLFAGYFNINQYTQVFHALWLVEKAKTRQSRKLLNPNVHALYFAIPTSDHESVSGHLTTVQNMYALHKKEKKGGGH